MFWHCVHLARFLNPTVAWCYEFEDFVGVMITCARACMAGSNVRIVGRKCLENFTLVLRLRLRQ